jgi:cytochrome c-type biogenesis protein CcmH/NrfG
LNDVVGLDSSQLDALAILGSNLYEQGRSRDAATIFEGLIALDANNYYGYAGMGALALCEEKLDEALDYLQTAAHLNPDDPTVHANMGETLLRKAQFNEAAAEFEKALKLDPDQRDPGANRARGILQGMHAAIKEMDRLNKLADSGKGATV